MSKSKIRLIALTILFFFIFSSLSLLHSSQTTAKSENEEESFLSAQQTIISLLNTRDRDADIQDYEWLALDLMRSEQELPSDFLKDLIDMIAEKEGILHTNNYDYTNYAKAVLVLTSCGIDATNVAGYNLIESLSTFPRVVSQGVNSVIYALLALDSGNYEVDPPDSLPISVTRDNYINSIVNSQLADGGWDYANKQADPDMTAMAIQALAPYYNANENVKVAIDKALQTLSNLQQPDGGFNTEDAQYKESSESTSMVILALTALGIDPTKDDRFIKNGLSTIDNLCSFAVDGGFKHTQDGKLNVMATDQGYRALTAYHRLKAGTTSFYNMTDVGELEKRDCKISFVNEDGTILEESWYSYGTTVDRIRKPVDPTKESTAQYSYTFSGWNPKIVSVTGDVTYTATYEAVINQYKVTFVDEDGTVLSEISYDYGTAASDIVKPSDPSNPVGQWYSFSFAGWIPEITVVTEAITYTATYNGQKLFSAVQNPNSWYYEPIYKIATTINKNDESIMSGFTDGTFGPTKLLTRHDFAIIIRRLADVKEEDIQLPAKSPFDDAIPGRYYYKSVVWANDNRLITGYADGSKRFGVGDNITREQIATILYRYADKYLGLDVETDPKGNLDDFTDGTVYSGYAKEALIWATGIGIISGKKDGETGKKIDARGNATRAEIAKMVFTFITYLNKQELIK